MTKKLFSMLFWAVMPLCLGGGGGSSSSANTTTTNNTDKRLVTGANSIGVTADNSNTTVNVLDGGAVAKSIDLAATVDANANKSLMALLGLANQAITTTQQQADKATAQVATAYDNAQGQGAQSKTLAYMVAGVVCIVGVMAFKGK